MKKKRIILTPDTGEIIKLENVTKKYPGSVIPAICDVSLSILSGEFIAVVGTSGSGKSTLLHMISGIEKPTKGKVFVSGRNIYDMNDRELSAFRCRKIGMVYQFFNLIPVLNVEENIAFPVIASGQKPDFEKIEKLLISLNLKSKGTSLPGNLSGGQQQRVAIGRAVMSSASLILADEPTGNLDSQNSREVIDLLEKLCRDNGKTLIIVTHDKTIAERADRIIQIEDGKIISDKKQR